MMTPNPALTPDTTTDTLVLALYLSTSGGYHMVKYGAPTCNAVGDGDRMVCVSMEEDGYATWCTYASYLSDAGVREWEPVTDVQVLEPGTLVTDAVATMAAALEH